MGFVLQGASQVIGGFAENAAAQVEADEFDKNSEQARLAGEQVSNIRKRDLLSTLSSIDAVRTNRGLSPTSPTGAAIRKDVRGQARRAAGVDQLNALNRQQQFRTQAALSRFRGKTAKLTGIIRGVGTVAVGVGKAASGGVA